MGYVGGYGFPFFFSRLPCMHAGGMCVHGRMASTTGGPPARPDAHERKRKKRTPSTPRIHPAHSRPMTAHARGRPAAGTGGMERSASERSTRADYTWRQSIGPARRRRVYVGVLRRVRRHGLLRGALAPSEQRRRRAPLDRDGRRGARRRYRNLEREPVGRRVLGAHRRGAGSHSKTTTPCCVNLYGCRTRACVCVCVHLT